MNKKPDSRGAAKGLNLDNLEDMVVGLRSASAATRNNKRLRDAARLEKKHAERKANAKKK